MLVKHTPAALPQRSVTHDPKAEVPTTTSVEFSISIIKDLRKLIILQLSEHDAGWPPGVHFRPFIKDFMNLFNRADSEKALPEDLIVDQIPFNIVN